MPASGPVSIRSSPISLFTRVDLPALGRPTMAIFTDLSPSSSSWSSSGGRNGDQRGVEVGQALAMLGGDRHRLAQPKAERLQYARVALATLGLVGGQHHGHVAAAQDLGEHLVHGGDALAAVDDEQRHVGLVDGQLRLVAHPGLQALISDILEAGGVDQLQIEVADPPGAEAPVPGDARPVIDDGQLAPRQPVEQRRLAHVGTPDDRKFQRTMNASGESGHRFAAGGR